METRHVKLEYEEALNAKKQLLSTELSILQTSKRLKNYKLLRKKELTKKSKIKAILTSLKSKLNLLISTFPDEEGNPKSPRKAKRKRQEGKKERTDLTQELENIEKKLAKLK